MIDYFKQFNNYNLFQHFASGAVYEIRIIKLNSFNFYFYIIFLRKIILHVNLTIKIFYH